MLQAQFESLVFTQESLGAPLCAGFFFWFSHIEAIGRCTN